MFSVSATMAEVLKQYGYATSAFGKWHNTPAEETTAAGPFEAGTATADFKRTRPRWSMGRGPFEWGRCDGN